MVAVRHRWAFLYYDHEEANLDIVVTENNNTPAMNPKTTPILVLDLWEHAYYLDVSQRVKIVNVQQSARYKLTDTRRNPRVASPSLNH